MFAEDEQYDFGKIYAIITENPRKSRGKTVQNLTELITKLTCNDFLIATSLYTKSQISNNKHGLQKSTADLNIVTAVKENAEFLELIQNINSYFINNLIQTIQQLI